MRATSRRALRPVTSAVLALTAIAACLLAVHGWSTRHSGATPGAFGNLGSSSPTAAPRSTPSDRPGRTTAGPQLSSEPYASAAYLVWPGVPSAAARTAMTGLSISARKTTTGLAVTAGVTGSPGSPRTYRGGARVYVVESALGDDAGSDYNLGDAGLVDTDAQGRIVS